nr:basic proline-rich protein-like [Aegilops tauschii subsp. strangulata]
MAACPHLRRKLCPRTSRLPPPGPPPDIRTSPSAAKVTSFGPRGHTKPKQPQPASRLELPGAATAHKRMGNGEEGERTHPRPTHLVPATGSLSDGAAHPSHQPPHRQPLCRPTVAVEADLHKATNEGPLTSQGTPQITTYHQDRSPGSPTTPLADVQPPEPAGIRPTRPPRPLQLRRHPYQPQAVARAAARRPGHPGPSSLARPDLEQPPLPGAATTAGPPVRTTTAGPPVRTTRHLRSQPPDEILIGP